MDRNAFCFLPVVTLAGVIGWAMDPPVARASSDVFYRGDASNDLVVDLPDGIFTLEFLFVGGPAPAIADAADASDDRAIDLSDPIVILEVLFVRPGQLPPPGMHEIGADPTPDELGDEDEEPGTPDAGDDEGEETPSPGDGDHEGEEPPPPGDDEHEG